MCGFHQGPESPKGEAGLSSDGRCEVVLLVSGAFGGTALRGRARDPTRAARTEAGGGRFWAVALSWGGQLGWSP